MNGQTARVVLLGVTGGMGMGKTTAARLLAGFGLPVADTDLIAREVVAPGEPALKEIRAAFGDDAFQADGTLDRGRLAELAFASPEARERLESILHPRIRAEWQRRVEEWRAQRQAMGVVIIPLLYETSAEQFFDAVLCVACSAKSQMERLGQRGWSEQQIQRRLAAQWPTETKILRAHFVVWTDPPVSLHEQQLRLMLASLGVEVNSPTRG